MVIDFHTHIFPEKIAAGTIEKLAAISGIKAYTDGTLAGLKRSMKEHNIDISVVLPVITKPTQFDTVISYAASINGREGIVSFGGIHPDTENYRDMLDRIKAMGLSGIKLHPDYQRTYIDDPKQINIIRYATDIGLIVVIHAGVDVGIPEPVHCTPKRASEMLAGIDNEDAKIIFAHTGGWHLWDEVEEYLVGKNVWFDTSFTLGYISDRQFVRIVKNHGADRVLFATDSPWSGQKETYEHMKSLDFTEEELERILHGNAEILLGLNGAG